MSEDQPEHSQTTQDASAPGPTFRRKLAVWISIAEREAKGVEGYKLYPCDWDALASLLREMENKNG